MTDDRIYLVAYDIADARRWRRVYRIMEGRGQWLQLSVFQCRLSRQGAAELRAQLDAVIHHRNDHVLIIELGPADSISPRIQSLGKAFAAVERKPVIV